ncbi:MAG TPA: GTPase HflX [Tetragenococcus sp.]|nr:GTPase HflX [Tetragenococcus sp.]
MKDKEQVILVGVETIENKATFFSSMSELASLTQTADGEVVFKLIQKRDQFDRQTLIGRGKLAELKQKVEEYQADLVIFDHELSPRQNQLLEDSLAIRVIDRVQLILDIFAQRARSKEGKLQVELAQLEYLFPRIIGQGKILSRLGGGIGTRGPGETKLESDRRLIRKKITAIRHELKSVEAHRQRTRQDRLNHNIFQIGLIGYTNAGKSTILNLLTQADAYEENQLFATLDPLTKKWRLSSGMEVTVTDTVGFIQDLPTQLVDAFHSTLEESQNMDLLLHVVDVSATDRLQQEQTVVELIDDLDLHHIPILTVYNKADLIDEKQFIPTQKPYLLISAKRSESKEELSQAIKAEMVKILYPYQLTLASDEGKFLEKLRRQTLLLETDFDEDKQLYKVNGLAKKGSFALGRMDQKP